MNNQTKINNVVSWRGLIGIVIEFIDEQNVKVYVPLIGKTYDVKVDQLIVLARRLKNERKMDKNK